MRSVWSAAGTCALLILSGITDKGCHAPLFVASARVWNQVMAEIPPTRVDDVVRVGADVLSQADVVAIARHGARIVLDDAALDQIAETRGVVDALAADPDPHYGVSTGFGALATTFIAPERR